MTFNEFINKRENQAEYTRIKHAERKLSGGAYREMMNHIKVVFNGSESIREVNMVITRYMNGYRNGKV